MKEVQDYLDFSSANVNERYRLERALGDLVELRHKLNDYKNEPRTLMLFEQVQPLRSRLELLKKSFDQLITSDENDNSAAEDFAVVVKKQLNYLNELQQGVFDYTRKVKSQV